MYALVSQETAHSLGQDYILYLRYLLNQISNSEKWLKSELSGEHLRQSGNKMHKYKYIYVWMTWFQSSGNYL